MAKSADAFRTISEVAEWLDTPAHVLRFWESRFTQVKPVKRAGGRRYFRPADMELLGGIKKLLHEDGMTIKGVQKKLKTEGVKAICALSQAVIPPSDAVINAKDEPVTTPTTAPESESSETQPSSQTPSVPEAPLAAAPVALEMPPPETSQSEAPVEQTADAVAPPAAESVTQPPQVIATPEPSEPDMPAAAQSAPITEPAPTPAVTDALPPLEPEDEADAWLSPQDLPAASEVEASLLGTKQVADSDIVAEAPISDEEDAPAPNTPAPVTPEPVTPEPTTPDITPPETPVLKPKIITLADDLADDADVQIPHSLVTQLRKATLMGNVADLRAANDRLTALHARLKANNAPNVLG